MAFEPKQVRLYGTEALPGDHIEHVADTSTSVVVDWRDSAVTLCAPPDCEKDIVYSRAVITDGERKGEPMELRMDVYYDAGAEKVRPCVLLIPGGAYMTCSRALYEATRCRLVSEGFVAAIMEYRVIGEGLITDAVADVNAALAYLRANAARWHIDPDRFALMGGSAGGHLTALTAVTGGKPLANVDTTPAKGLRAAIDLYGISDMARIGWDFGDKTHARHLLPCSAESQYVNGCLSGKGITEDPAAAAAADPLTHVDGSEPPFMFMHGDADLLVSPSGTLRLHNALREKGVPSVRYSLVGAPHGGPMFECVAALDADIAFLKDNMMK